MPAMPWAGSLKRFVWMSKGCATVAQLLRQQRLSKSIKYMARMSIKSIVILVLARGAVGSVVVASGSKRVVPVEIRERYEAGRERGEAQVWTRRGK
eukprot:6466794-Amphidinium_carterae.6